MQSQDKTSTQSVKPYNSQFIDYAMDQGKSIYQNNLGQRNQLAKLNKTTKNAMETTKWLAKQPVPGLDATYAAQSSMLNNGGMTPGMQNAAGILGGYSANYGMTPGLEQTAGYLKNFASGSYQEDPRLLRMVENERNNATNAALTSLGGGRYGSAAIGNGIGKAQAAATDGLMLQSNENARNRQLQASGMLDGLYQNAANRGLSAAGAMGSLYSQGADNMAQWGSMTGALNDLRYDGTSRLAGVGDFYQNRKQTNLDNKRGAPKDNLSWLNGILGGLGATGRTTTSTTPGPSAAQSILGGAATGGAMFGPWGALGGGILGAFA